MLKVGIIGGGAIAQVHAQVIETNTESEFVALAELMPDIRKEYSRKYGIEAYEDYNNMLQEVDLDAVTVCLPHHLHLPAAKAAMKAGLHVLLEKPMEISVERCNELIECSVEYGKKLFIAHPQRYLPLVKDIKNELLSETAGKPLMGSVVHYCQYYTQGRPNWFKEKSKAGGGNLMNHGVHYIDRLSWLFASRVKQVHARLQYDKTYSDQESIVNLMLVFENDLTATILLSGAGGNRQHTEIACSQGILSYDGNSNELLIQKNISDKEWYGKLDEHKKRVDENWSLAVKDVFSAFVDCIKNDTEPTISGEYGKYILQVVTAAYESAKSGKVIDVF